MNRSFKVSLLLLAVFGMNPFSVVFAQAVKSQPFVAPPGEPIKSIALLRIPEPRGYFLGEGGLGAGGLVFGIPGILAETLKKPEHPEYERADFHFSAVAERLLTEHLKTAGFNVISVPVDRQKPHQLLRNYKALSVPNVDAYLDVATLGIGYRKSRMGGALSSKVGPYVSVVVRLVSARSKKILYGDTIEYGWSKARIGVSGTDIDAPDDQVFEDTEAVKNDLTSADSKRGIAYLQRGIDVATRVIVAGLTHTRWEAPAEGEASKIIGQDTFSGGGTASGNDISVASVSPSDTKWTQKPIEDFKSIAGKWQGSGVTAQGEHFSVDISFADDGSYTFRAGGGMTRSARMHIDDGVLKGRSMMTGDPVTVTLYKDENGNRVLKARRLDGLTWTVREAVK